MPKKKVIFLELNEVNFELYDKYAQRYSFKNFEFIKNNFFKSYTTSENKYHLLEPWIQWYSIHTGLTYDNHKVFALGDCETKKHSQIWEEINKMGYSVGAISPMNTSNKNCDYDFFIPDPWTNTSITGSFLDKIFYKSVSSLVNDNANQSSIKINYLFFCISAVRFINLSILKYIFSNFLSIFKKRWHKAIILDYILSNAFFKLVKKHNTEYASLFLNGAAHIQHHYMFNSQFIAKQSQNPEWYLSQKDDPIYDIYMSYDVILGNLIKFSKRYGYKIIIATGLQQKIVEQPTFYYRLKNHEDFIEKLGIKYKRIQKLMSRDFTIFFENEEDREYAFKILSDLSTNKNEKIFSISCKGKLSIFATLSYEHEIKKDLNLRIDSNNFIKLENYCDFVAIKNSEHDGIGTIFENFSEVKQSSDGMNVANIFHLLNKYFST